MKLYEIKHRTARQGSGSVFGLTKTRYYTSKARAELRFRTLNKRADVVWVELKLCIVRTDLKSDDWCELLQADAPGPVENLTPQDLITSHELLSRYEEEAAA